MIIYLGNCKTCKKQFELGKKKPTKENPQFCPECKNQFSGISQKNIDDKLVVLSRKYAILKQMFEKKMECWINRRIQMGKHTDNQRTYINYIKEYYPEIHKETIKTCFNVEVKQK